MKRSALVLVVAAAAVLALVPAGIAVGQEMASVVVTNWPRVYSVDGEVRVPGPIRRARLVSKTDITVPPVSPKDTNRLVSAGSIETDGFPAVVLSLAGQTKGQVARAGGVGAILIPETELFEAAFREQEVALFPLEVAASGVSNQSSYFGSNQPRYPVAFPSYRVLLWNTTDKTVTVNLYAYLTQ